MSLLSFNFGFGFKRVSLLSYSMMASHKSKQYWLVALKVLVLVLALGYIFVKIRDEQVAVLENFTSTFQLGNGTYWLLFIVLAAVNWMLEIYKWKVSVNTWFPLKFKEAIQQSLGSLTASLITPNRIGEYGAKALYFKPKHRKKILFLNFMHSSSQMAVTVLFGVPALFYFIGKFSISIALTRIVILPAMVVLLFVLGLIYRKKQLGFKGLSLENLWKKLKKITFIIKLKLIALSVGRYLVFSFLFYQLLHIFDASMLFKDAAVLIFTMYFLVSIVPSFFIMDVVIRGGVAVWLFSFLGVSDIAVLSTVFIMWLLNTVLPALIGSYFILTFKPKYS